MNFSFIKYTALGFIILRNINVGNFYFYENVWDLYFYEIYVQYTILYCIFSLPDTTRIFLRRWEDNL